MGIVWIYRRIRVLKLKIIFFSYKKSTKFYRKVKNFIKFQIGGTKDKMWLLVAKCVY